MAGRFLSIVAGTLLLQGVGDYGSIVDTVNRGGVIAVLIGAVLGLAWISRWLLRQLLAAKESELVACRAELADWRTIAMGTLHLGERATTLAEQRVGIK